MVAHTEVSLSKLNKDELVRIALDFQQKQDLLLNKINSDLTDLKKSYAMLESELLVSRTVTTRQKKQIIELERQCWSNEQYSRRECLEVAGIPNNTQDSELEETVLNVFDKIDVSVQPEHIEACHWIKSNGSAKVIVKFSRRKDADKVRKAKKKLKSANLSTMGITNPVYINDSLCRNYKILWSKCKKLLHGKFIHGFWVTNGTLRIKINESAMPKNITHPNDLEELFPGNSLLADQTEG